MKIEKENLIGARWAAIFKKFKGNTNSLSMFMECINERQNIAEDLDTTLIMLGQRCSEGVEFNSKKKTLELL